jgi:hypothetical protein
VALVGHGPSDGIRHFGLRGCHHVDLDVDGNANLEPITDGCGYNIRDGSIDRMVSTLDRRVENGCTGCDAIALRS